MSPKKRNKRRKSKYVPYKQVKMEMIEFQDPFGDIPGGSPQLAREAASIELLP